MELEADSAGMYFTVQVQYCSKDYVEIQLFKIFEILASQFHR